MMQNKTLFLSRPDPASPHRPVAAFPLHVHGGMPVPFVMCHNASMAAASTKAAIRALSATISPLGLTVNGDLVMPWRALPGVLPWGIGHAERFAFAVAAHIKHPVRGARLRLGTPVQALAVLRAVADSARRDAETGNLHAVFEGRSFVVMPMEGSDYEVV